MSTADVTVSQVRYVNKTFWRNPARAFFTFAFPLILLVIFTSLLGNGTERIGTLTIKESAYYVVAMAAFGVIQACCSNIAAAVTFQRDAGILKRIDGSPMPKTSFMGSRIVHSMAVGLLLVIITAAFGRAFYGVTIPTGMDLARFLVMLIVGAGAFCALGLAVTAAIPNADAAQPVILGTVLPLCFLSGIFIPFHPVQQQHAVLADLDRPHLPGPAFRCRDDGRLYRHPVRLDRRAHRGRPGAWPDSCSPSASSAGSRTPGDTGAPARDASQPIRADEERRCWQ